MIITYFGETRKSDSELLSQGMKSRRHSDGKRWIIELTADEDEALKSEFYPAGMKPPKEKYCVVIITPDHPKTYRARLRALGLSA